MRRIINDIQAYSLILPALLFVVGLLLFPVIQNIYFSFFEYDGFSEPTYIGLQNYIEAFNDESFLLSLMNSCIWVIFTMIFPVAGGLLIANYIRQIKFETFFKSIFYIPLTLSFVSTALIWKYMFGLEHGVLNEILSWVGIQKFAWLNAVPFNTFSMLISWTWQQLGANMVLFLLGLAAIPQSPVEAANLDGANSWQIFIHVTFPMLRPITTVVVAFSILNSFKAFDLIWVMTKGGPYRSSETLAITMFKEAFSLSRMGYGAAISILLSLFVIVITGGYMWYYRKQDQLHY